MNTQQSTIVSNRSTCSFDASRVILLLIALAALIWSGTHPGEDRSAERIPPAAVQTVPRRRKNRGRDCDDAANIAASYARFSSKMQNEQSISDQQRCCRERGEQDGLTCPANLEFSDSAISGTKRDREGLDAMLAAARAGGFKTLIVFSLSRLARESVITMPLLKELVHDHGIRVISASEGLDTAREGWEIHAIFSSLQDEQFIRTLSANVFRGQEGTVLDGFAVGDHRYGYTTVPSPGGERSGRGRHSKPRMIYMIHEPEAEWVRRIFSWFVNERRPIAWIVRQLNALNVPKCRRARTPHWYPELIVAILKSPKYIGIWSWGLNKTRRKPLTGETYTEPRPEHETAKWTRQLEHLRIVDDVTFEAAQARLREQEEALAEARRDDGRLGGSDGSTGRRHLLWRVLQCGACGRTMLVSGSKGKYMQCPGHLRHICECRTHLSRRLAESLILDAIGQQILRNALWKHLILDEVVHVVGETRQQLPKEIAAENAAIEELEVRKKRILQQIEYSDQPDPALNDRLREIRDEQETHRRNLKELKAREISSAIPELPTLEWIDSQLSQLQDVLSSATPAAGEALRGLLDGPIVMEEVAREGRSRRFLRGTLRLRVRQVTSVVLGLGAVYPEGTQGADQVESIVIDFVSVSKTAIQAELAWPLYEQGLLCCEIARQLGVSRSRATAILKAAAKERGVVFVDGRERRSTLKDKCAEPPLRARIREDVLRMWTDGALVIKIAEALQVDRATVTKILKNWYSERGEAMPDGRARRKELNERRGPDADSSAPESGQGEAALLPCGCP